jgi:hypothetical protein
MPDTKSKSFAEEVMRKNARITGRDDHDNSGRKRHTSAGAGTQAFTLRADFKDGRKKRGTAWSHFSDYEWNDEGDIETLTIIFGDRIVTMRGFNLLVLVREIDEGKLKTFEELVSAEAKMLRENPDDEAVVVNVEIFPEFKELVQEIKGEREHEAGHAGRLKR